MNAEQRRIDDYADAFQRHLPPPDRVRRRAELVEHLIDAAEAGDLDETLERLGDPEHAAHAFLPQRPSPEAPFLRRAGAALVDNLPLLGLAVALLVYGNGRGGFDWAFPPLVYLQWDGVCMVLSPGGGCGYYNAGLLYAIGVPLALAWSIGGLAVLESRLGVTPGKWLARLGVVTETGLRLRLGPAIVRRLSFLLGPAAWLDWLPFLAGRQRRLLDYLANAKVVVQVRSTV